jgi:hypothetical protein
VAELPELGATLPAFLENPRLVIPELASMVAMVCQELEPVLYPSSVQFLKLGANSAIPITSLPAKLDSVVMLSSCKAIVCSAVEVDLHLTRGDGLSEWNTLSIG